MATVYITEYVGPMMQIGIIPIAQEPEIASQTVAIGAGSVQSSAFNLATTFIRVHTDAICSVKVGSNPTATAASKRLAANQTEYFGVSPGHKIAVITNS